MAATTATVAGTVAAGAISAKGAKDAADASADGAGAAAQVQREMYQQTREDLAPYRQTGERSLNVLADTMGLQGRDANYDAFKASPGYNFRLAEGNKAIDRSAAARGMLMSGRQLKGLTNYNQGMASQEFGNWFNRMGGLAQSGQNAATQTGSFGMNTAGNVGNAMMAGGNARASGYMDQANAYSNAIGGLSRIAGKQWGDN